MGRPCVGEAVALYVSPKGSDSWSGLFPDPLPDGSDGPLATLEAARDRVRGLRRQGRPVTVYLRGGVYHLSAPLVLGPEDSGGEGCPVVWQAYPGEEPIISGGLRITGFRQVDLGGRSAWVAEVPRGWTFKQLFVNGERRPRSRLPKEGFYRIAGVPSYAGKRLLELQLFEGADEFSFEPGQLRAWRNLQEVDVVILHFWVEERIPLRSVDESRGVARLSAKTVFAIRDGFAEEYPRYYVENVFEALSEPGEWYLDAAEGVLYYLPRPGGDPSSSVVVAPRHVWRLLEVKGEPERGRFVENIVLSNGSPIFQGGYAQRYSMRNIVSDRNDYWDLTGRLTVCREQATGRECTLDEWRALGYDRLSIVDDPLLASVELRDFKLRDSSPALRLGFRRLCRNGQKG
ncbi:MAG: hypothetical protein QW518_04760 [Thermofilaceae archaeon]